MDSEYYYWLIGLLVPIGASWITIRYQRQNNTLLNEAKKSHSDDLRDILLEWSKELCIPPSAMSLGFLDNTHTYVEQIPDYQPYQITIEANDLFADLSNHVPNLMKKWHKYKQKYDKYLSQKQSLSRDMLNFVRQSTGLQIHESSGPLPKETVILDHAISLLFHDLYNISNDRKPDWFSDNPVAKIEIKNDSGSKTLWLGAQGIFHSDNVSEMTSLLTHFKSIIAEPEKLLDKILINFRKHKGNYDTVIEDREYLLKEIERKRHIRILPKTCDYIKQSGNK